MGDLKSRPWIVIKGLLFLAIALGAALLVWLRNPTLEAALLLGVLAWSAARFYYFLFYVLEKYVDPGLKYAGILALARTAARRGRPAGEAARGPGPNENAPREPRA